MRINYRLLIVIGFILLTAVIDSHSLSAQEQADWSAPFILSSNRGKASEAYSVADDYGYVHVFWTETLPDERLILRYARYAGETWSLPIDIRVTQPFVAIGNISPTVDEAGMLHIVWTESEIGPAYHMSAPAHDAISVQNWQSPQLIKVSGNRIKLQIDANGTFHALYVKFLGQEQGVYYIRSEDGGINWSDPVWLDPDIWPDYGPRALNFELDDAGGLHASWYYVPREALGGDWVRYVHSLDGGDTWSQPFTIDRLDEEAISNDESLSAAGPVMAVVGQTVHIIWAGGKLHYRHHRYSTDAGITWSTSRRVFGELNGQAFDGLTVDPAGRVHFVGQIRFPMGIYHSIWQDGQWTKASLIYLIRHSSTDPVGNKIEAHDTHPIIRGGNQLVLTFNDPPPNPDRRLFVMERTLDDIPPAENLPTPTPIIEAPPPLETLTPPPTAVPTRSSFGGEIPDNNSNSTGQPLLLGFIATLILTGSTITFRLLKNRL